MPFGFRKKRERNVSTSAFDSDGLGSVIGILGLDSKQKLLDVRRQLVEAGIRKVREPFGMEVLMIRDPRNVVTEKLRLKKTVPCYFNKVLIAKGEKGSRLRHGMPRLAVTLDGPYIRDRYKALFDHGFLNIHHREGPILIIKDEPDPEDVEIAQSVFTELDKKDEYTEYVRETWAYWR